MISHITHINKRMSSELGYNMNINTVENEFGEDYERFQSRNPKFSQKLIPINMLKNEKARKWAQQMKHLVEKGHILMTDKEDCGVFKATNVSALKDENGMELILISHDR